MSRTTSTSWETQCCGRTSKLRAFQGNESPAYFAVRRRESKVRATGRLHLRQLGPHCPSQQTVPVAKATLFLVVAFVRELLEAACRSGLFLMARPANAWHGFGFGFRVMVLPSSL